MGYNRTYSRNEVIGMLHRGHAFSMHSEQRSDPFDRAEIVDRNNKEGFVPRDSTFCAQQDLILAVEQALHDPLGQQTLATLRDKKEVVIKMQLSSTPGNSATGEIRANIVKRAGQERVDGEVRAYFEYDMNVPANAITVVIRKVPNLSAESWAPLHIVTAYPS